MISFLKVVVFSCVMALQVNANAFTPPSFQNDSLGNAFGEYNNQVNLLRRDLKAEDSLREAAGLPPRFALPNTTFLTPYSHGTWEDLNESKKVWRLKVNSDQATSVNLGFTHFYLPKSAELFIYAPDRSQVRGPFLGENYNSLKEFWSPVILGDELVVELVVNKSEQDDVYMILGSVNHGYRGFGTKSSNERSGSCNIDVACEISAGWEDQIRSVAVISTGGSTFCTGFLVNNTNQDLKPLFMTANHCRINGSNAASLVSYWNYNNTTCREPNSSDSGSSGDGQLDQFSSGATFKASGSQSDFTIVEFNQDIDPDFDVFYAGWDARLDNPVETTAIHHPSTDEKRISFDYDPGTTTSYLGNNPEDGGTHIRVADWDVGTTEPGSSGSPLFDQNQRVVGQLHGGRAACGNNSADWYGRISYSWENGLREVLDPNNTGRLFVDGIGSEVDYLLATSFVGFEGLGEDDFIKPGDTLTGSLVFENSGTQAITDFSIDLNSDSEMIEVFMLDSITSLEPGESVEVDFQMNVSSGIICGSNFTLAYNVEYEGLNAVGEIQSSVGKILATSVSQSLSLSIPDDNSTGVRTEMSFSDTGETVSDLTVGLDITHSYVGDLKVQLISPQGSIVTLHNNSGAGDDNILGEYPLTLSPFDDLSQLNGEALDGSWALTIVDSERQDVGALNYFEIKNKGTVVCQ